MSERTLHRPHPKTVRMVGGGRRGLFLLNRLPQQTGAVLWLLVNHGCDAGENLKPSHTWELQSREPLHGVG